MKRIFQITGYKNSGKTTLIEGLLPIFLNMKLKTCVIKHDVHGFEADPEGTDTNRFRQAGAAATVITSPWRTSLVMEEETPLPELVSRFEEDGSYDLILIEGFKREHYPKVVLLRSIEDIVLLDELTHIKGILIREESQEGIMSAIPSVYCKVPCYLHHETERIAELILNTTGS